MLRIGQAPPTGEKIEKMESDSKIQGLWHKDCAVFHPAVTALLMKLPNGIHIGTSGWNYDGWKGDFYPEKIGGTGMLEEYGRIFGTVEVNGTFYSLPNPDTVRDWTNGFRMISCSP